MPATASNLVWSESTALVTGATGLLGSRLVHRLIELGARVVCFVRDHDPASALWFNNDHERVNIVSGRLEAFEQVKTTILEREVDTVFHLGAQTIVGISQRDPLGSFEANIRGTYHILEACRLYGDRVRRILIASSDKAYGESPNLPYDETTPLAAKNPYDVSKCCADLIAQSYAHTYQLPIAIARCGNLFGPGDLTWSRLVPGTIRSLLTDQRPIDRSDGTLVRDYLFVDDAVEAYLAMANWLETDCACNDAQRAFNFSPNQPLTVLEMMRRLQDACGRADLEPVILNEARGEIPHQHLDPTRAKHVLGWTAQTNLDDALAITVEWYRSYLQRFHPGQLARQPALSFHARAGV